MKYVGVDLHKKSISICVMRLDGQKRIVVARKRFACSDTEGICRFFEQHAPFQVVVEATASYEWFLRLVEPLAQRMVLAHPKKLRVIAESTKKTDKIDAQVLAEFLALDMIPEAYRPTPRQREHRALVRYRYYVQKRVVSVRNKIRRLLADYNADTKDLFTVRGLERLAELRVSQADRFVLDHLVQEWREHGKRLKEADRQLAVFAKTAPALEREGRQVLDSFPIVGPVTIDVVLSEVGDARRFRSLKRAASFAGLAPGVRKSAERSKGQGITKEGSRLLRWAMIQTAWRLVRCQRYWKTVFERLQHRRGKKLAITAVARRAFCIMIAMLRSGQSYRLPDAAAPRDFPRQDKGVRGREKKQ
jgi:transposase